MSELDPETDTGLETGGTGSGTVVTPQPPVTETTPVAKPKPAKSAAKKTSADKADAGTTATAPVAAASADELPHTGGNATGLLAGAAGLVLLGGIALQWSRRQASHA